MSAYIKYATPMIEEDVLITALCEMGFAREHIEVHENPKVLVGYQGRVRPEMGHIVIRRQHVGTASNDIGFIKEEGGYRMIISDYDQNRYNTNWRTNRLIRVKKAENNSQINEEICKLKHKVKKAQQNGTQQDSK